MSEQNQQDEQDLAIKIEVAVKDGWKRIKRFASEHPTVTASVVTGVISWKMGKRRAVKQLGDEIGQLAEMVYEYGTEAGALELQNVVLLDFINENNLGDQVREFIREHVTVERS